MNTKILSQRALSVIDQYLHFKIDGAVCSIPYFNNKTTKSRAALRVYIGKGSPKDIYDEVQSVLVKAHASKDSLSGESLKKLLADTNIGIDCSGFAYYVLNAESEETNKGRLDKKLSFLNSGGIIGKLRAKLRPVENCSVTILAHDHNSSVVEVKDIQPGDMITLLDNQTTEMTTARGDRDHILVIHQVEYQNFVTSKIHYSHAVAYPEDGTYGTGIKQGMIEITDPKKPITEAVWVENTLTGASNRIHMRAKSSKTEVRRLR